MPAKSAITKEERIATIHEALDQYSVLVYNGQPEPKKMPIGQAITTISEDLRIVKTGQKEHGDLLTGIKQRKKAWTMVVSLLEYGKASKTWKLITVITLVVSALYGFISMMDSTFGWKLLQ